LISIAPTEKSFHLCRLRPLVGQPLTAPAANDEVWKQQISVRGACESL
jgi:hypothetical protein